MSKLMNKYGKRGLTLLLALVMSFSLIIPSTFAEDEAEGFDKDEIVVDANAEITEEDTNEDEDLSTYSGVAADSEDAEVEDNTFDSDNNIALLADYDEEGAYVSGLGITDTVDGTAPWDGNNNPGNDMDGENGIVRTFDYVYYTLSYQTALTDSMNPVGGGILYAEFVLPCSPKTAIFDMDNMAWLVDAVTTYTFTDGSTSTEYDMDSPEDVVCQTLTGYRELSAVPGTGTLSVGLYIGAATNGETIQPEFTLYMGGNVTGVHDPLTVTSKILTISAAQKYSFKIGQAANMNIYGDYDLSTGNSAAPYDVISEQDIVRGRMEGYSITIMMQNDTEEKGLRGLEFPSGTITFDITLDEYAMNASGERLNETKNFSPVMWDYSENEGVMTSTGYFGRKWQGGNLNKGLTQSSGPWNRLGCHTYSSIYDSCYDGGDWKIEWVSNDPFTYHVTIENYNIDTKDYIFPTTNNTYFKRTEPGTAYKANQACFSSGAVNIVMQFPVEVTEITNVYFTITADNLKVNGEMFDATGTYSNTYKVEPSGTISQHLCFTNTTVSGYSKSGCLGSSESSGDGYSFRGNNIRIGSRIESVTDQTIYSEIQFVKWDANAFEINRNGKYYSSIGYTDNGTLDGYFVGREENWSSLNEMCDTLMNTTDVRYFKSLDDLESEGLICVGILYTSYDDNIISTVYNKFSMDLTVKDDSNLIGNTYPVVMDSAAFYENVFPMEQIDDSSEYVLNVDKLYTIDNNNDGVLDSPDLYVAYCGKDAYSTMGKTSSSDRYYVKSEYDENGNIISGTHLNASNAGNSLLICGEKDSVEVSFDNAVYDLDAGQRTAVVTVQPYVDIEGSSYSGSGDNDTTKTTVTVEVTLPYDLTYDVGSAKWGDTSIEPQIIENSDDTITLKFILEDVTIGDKLDVITIDCAIGHAGTMEDVENNQNISVTATISSTNDNRSRLEAFGNMSIASMTVIRLTSASISKEVDTPYIEMNGGFEWSLKFSNTSNSDIVGVDLADVFPYDGDTIGSSFSGGYSVDQIVFDFSDAVNSYNEDLDDMELAIATLPVYETSEELVKDGEDYPSDWVIIHNADYGVSIDRGTHIITFDIQEILKGTEYEGTTVYGFYLILGNLDANNYITITISVSTYDNKPGDVYYNIYDEDADNQNVAVSSNKCITQVVERDVNGLAWFDSNIDGIREDTEDLLPGIGVALYRTTPSRSSTVVKTIDGVDLYPAYDVFGNEVSAVSTYALTTGEYAFNYLEAGTYYVVFNNITNGYGMTARNIGSDNTDSDAIGVINDTLTGVEYAYIPNIELPTIDNMISYLYESEHNDIGVIEPTAEFTIQKIDNESGSSLSNAEFTLTYDDGSETVITTGKDGLATSGLKVGSYTLQETKAPAGYVLDRTVYSIAVSLQDNNDEAWTAILSTDIEKNQDDLYIISNDSVFDLPNTGGSGIIPWCIAGTVVLAGATCAVFGYRKKIRQ